MKITTPFNSLKNAISDVWRMHDFNHKLPKEAKQDFWEKEYRASSKCSLQGVLKLI